MGNGLRADVWQSFQRRFGPIRILETYGSTEGNAGFVNYPGRCGALGKMSCLLRMLSPFELVQFDTEAEEPVRDTRGLCVPVGPGIRVGKPSRGAARAGVCSAAAAGWGVSAQAGVCRPPRACAPPGPAASALLGPGGSCPASVAPPAPSPGVVAVPLFSHHSSLSLVLALSPSMSSGSQCALSPSRPPFAPGPPSPAFSLRLASSLPWQVWGGRAGRACRPPAGAGGRCGSRPG